MNRQTTADTTYFLRRLVDHAPMMLAYWGSDMRCRFANRAYETWFGVDPQRLVGTSIRELLGPDLFALNEPYIQGALRGEPQQFERAVPGPGGVVRHSLAHYVPDVVDDRVVGFMALVTEVTALKETQAQLHSAIRSLEAEAETRRGVEASLFDVQESLAVTLDSIGAGFIATDSEGRVTRMNPEAERLVAWPQGEARGRSIWDVVVREDRPAEMLVRNPVDVMLEHGITVNTAHHVVVVARDGTRMAVEVKAALTRAKDGAVRGMTVVMRDMTRQRAAEAASVRLAAIVESSWDAIIGKTLDGRITSWNAAAQAIFGYTPEEAIGQPIQMLIPPDRLHEEARIVADLARGVRVPPFDTVRLTKDGRLIDISATISPIRDAEGRISGASKIARDITRQRHAEAALRASEARLRFTLESAQIGDWELDLETLAVTRSVQHDRCFGYQTLQPVWTLQTLLRHVHAEDLDAVTASFDAAVASGSDWRVECRVVWPDASIHWIDLHGSLQHGLPPARRMLGIVSDITRRKQADEVRIEAARLEAENRQILATTRLKSQFLANMSHELRTPLNAIIGFADLLHSGAVPPASPKHNTFIGHIASSGRHLLQLINDVLDLSKVEAGKFEFFPQPIDLKALVREVNDILQTAIDRKRITLTTEIEANLNDLVLDPARLKQVLYNFLSNAIKFTPDGGRIAVRARGEGAAHVRIEVEDNGIGIAPEQLPRLFTEFQQLDAGYSRQHEGTGLGLALTRRLVQAQGGSVGVHSELGRGSVFHVVLNRVHGTDLARDAVVVGEPAVEAAGPPHMLVIEDDRLVQSRIVQALLRQGFRVQAASTGGEALQRARERPFGAVTLDLLLPDRAGLRLLADIRSEGQSRTSPVVGVSVPATTGATASFAIEDILSKPIRGDEVIAAIGRLHLSTARRARVMVIDDDPLALDLMRATLKAIGIDAVCHQDGREALRELAVHRPDAIILDLMMPGFDGFAVLDALQGLPQSHTAPVFIWTSMILTSEEYLTLARSAQEIIGKGGGALAVMLERLRDWRPRAATLPEGESE